MTSLGKHSPHDVLAPLVQGDLDKQPRPGLGNYPEPVGTCRAVGEVDADG